MRDFAQMAQLVNGTAPESSHEKLVWELAHILFDSYEDDISADVPADQQAEFEHRIRRDRLTRFWQQLVQDSASNAASTATTAEERAIAHLSAHDVENACDALIQGKDFRLATLVAQIGGDQVMREDMADQINEWRNLNVLSEFTEPIRALYELVAGNACVCEGKTGPLEDRARTFVISERFGMDWKRAFGLRLWYATGAGEPIEHAIDHFTNDLESGREVKRPVTWFVEQGLEPLWRDEHAADRVDLLWGLLTIYADTAVRTPEKIAQIVMPENVGRNSMNARLSFQLYHALTYRVLHPEYQTTAQDAAAADSLATSFITQLSTAGDFPTAIFAALHLSNPAHRQRTIQSLLAQNAPVIDPNSPNTTFQTLTSTLQIPPAWIHESLALHSRSVSRDHVAETTSLLAAHNYEEAHKTLVQTVGPRAIIESDYGLLERLLAGFDGEGVREAVQGWSLGGGVFADFSSVVSGAKGGDGDRTVLERLVGALAGLGAGKEGVGKLGFEQRVAVEVMGGVVARRLLEMRSGVSFFFSILAPFLRGEVGAWWRMGVGKCCC